MEFMTTEQSNLGKVDYAFRMLMHESLVTADGSAHLSKEQVEEVAQQLKEFIHLLGNSFLHQSTLQQEAPQLAKVLQGMEYLYRDYKGTSPKETKNVF